MESNYYRDSNLPIRCLFIREGICARASLDGKSHERSPIRLADNYQRCVLHGVSIDDSYPVCNTVVCNTHAALLDRRRDGATSADRTSDNQPDNVWQFQRFGAIIIFRCVQVRVSNLVSADVVFENAATNLLF